MPTATAFKLNPADKARWVADLRSGKFQQGDGTLYFYDQVGLNDENPTEQFCCLGVYGFRVCDISKQEMVDFSMLDSSFTDLMGEHDIPMYVQTVLACLNDGDDPTDSIKTGNDQDEWSTLAAAALDFQHSMGVVDKYDSNYIDRGCSFAEIADFIEANL